MPAIKPLAAMLTKFANPTGVAELAKAQNVALVAVTRDRSGQRRARRRPPRRPRHEHRRRDQPERRPAVRLPDARPAAARRQAEPGIFALSEGPVDIEDPTTPTVGVVKGGCVMEADLPAKAIDNGRFTLILEDPVGELDHRQHDRQDDQRGRRSDDRDRWRSRSTRRTSSSRSRRRARAAGRFISRVLRCPCRCLPKEARVQINDKTGTLISPATSRSAPS